MDTPKTSWGICVKCGSDRNAVHYQCAGNWSPEMEAQGRGQWLDVTCQCGYEWRRPCEDRVMVTTSTCNMNYDPYDPLAINPVRILAE